MTGHEKRRLVPCIALALAVMGTSCNSGSSTRPPNILLIVADDMGWRDAGYLGSRTYLTPNLDALAATGVVFTNAYSNGPNCAPSRAALMSGFYAPRTGVYTVATSERGRSADRRLVPVPNTTRLDTSFVTLAERLRDAGYATAHMGKWHLGEDAFGPEGQGFDVNVGGGRRGAPPSYFHPYGPEGNRIEDLAAKGSGGDYLTDALTEAAVDFVRANAQGPFFLYLPHYAVHTPIQAPDLLVDRWRASPMDSLHDNPVYAAMLESMDAGIGRVLGLLDSLMIADETVVVFISDNGGHGPTTSMHPLRGAKGMLYEGGIRVPLIVRPPDGAFRPRVVDEPVIGLDLYPTLLELAGVPLSPDRLADGVSLVPLLAGEAIGREALFWHFPAYLEAYQGGLSDSPWRTTPAGAIRRGRYKLIEHFEDGRLQLFDLEADIGETIDLASTRPALADTLHRVLIDWRREVGAPVPTLPNPDFVER